MKNQGIPIPKPILKEILFTIEILHYLKDPKLWELWYIPCYEWVMQDIYPQP